jgi:carbon-monoxide dehydrogenase large subunit
VLRSPHAHAQIRSIDTKVAVAMDGVAAVYTGEDLIKDGCRHHSYAGCLEAPFPVSSRSSSRRLTGLPAPNRRLPGRMFISLFFEFL